jgi:hypothetical protein
MLRHAIENSTEPQPQERSVYEARERSQLVALRAALVKEHLQQMILPVESQPQAEASTDMIVDR